MSSTRIRRHDTIVDQLVLGNGDSLAIASGGELHVGGSRSAIMLAGGTAVITNHGVIRSDGGIAINGVPATVEFTLRNTGLIAGGSIGIGIASDEGATGSVTIRNWGSITAARYAAIDHSFVHLDRTLLVNNGDLNGPQPGSSSAPFAFVGSDGRDILLNHGTIHGQVLLGAGDDFFRDTGLSDGMYHTVMGGDGNDRISGGGGPDLIVGGSGRDILQGGGGSDIFGYEQLSDSQGESVDRIRDFNSSGADIIDLSRLDANATLPADQVFSFIGASAFSGTVGELRCTMLRGGGAVVSADVDGDAVADFTLVVRGNVHVPDDLHFML